MHLTIATALAPRCAPPAMAAGPGAAAVVGAGPAGLLTAIMLAQRGWPSVDVFDARSEPPAASDPAWGAGERSYQIGLNGRGQAALRRFGAFDRVDTHAASVKGRLSFDPAGAPVESRFAPPGTPGAEKSYVTRVLQRDRLQACLLEEVRAAHPSVVRVHFGVACDGVDLGGERPVVRLCDAPADAPAADEAEACAVDAAPRAEAFDLVVGADGVASAVRASLEAADGSTTRLVRYVDDNARVFKTLPLSPSLVDGTAADLNWGVRNRSLDVGVDALPTAEGEMVAVLLFRPDSAASAAIDGLATAADADAFLRGALPALRPYVREDELARFAARPVGRLPSFHRVDGDVHAALPAGGVVLLGDAIKAVKPYFGQGANSALEDVAVLADCLAAADDAAAAAAAGFTAARADDARALVRISRGFDHPGPLGTARFLLPLLLDLQLAKLVPALFTPPILRGLQSEERSFVCLLRRKRAERAGLAAAALALAAAAAPRATGTALYAGGGVGLGYGLARLAKWARAGGDALGLAAVPLLWLRARARAALLRLDPSLADDEGATIGWRDLRKATPLGGGPLKRPRRNPFERPKPS